MRFYGGTQPSSCASGMRHPHSNLSQDYVRGLDTAEVSAHWTNEPDSQTPTVCSRSAQQFQGPAVRAQALTNTPGSRAENAGGCPRRQWTPPAAHARLRIRASASHRAVAHAPRNLRMCTNAAHH